MFSVTIHDTALVDVTNKLSSMNISKKNIKSNKICEVKEKYGQKGPLDRFLVKEKMKEDSLTLSDFECDSISLDLSNIVNGIITK